MVGKSNAGNNAGPGRNPKPKKKKKSTGEKPDSPTRAEILEIQRQVELSIPSNHSVARNQNPNQTSDINESLEWSGGGPGWVPNETEYRIYRDYVMGRDPLAIMFDAIRNPQRLRFSEVGKIVNAVYRFNKRQVTLFSDMTPEERHLESLKASASTACEAFERSREDSVETITSPDGRVTVKRSGQIGNSNWLTAASTYTQKIREVHDQHRSSSVSNGGLIPSSLGKTQLQVQIEFLENAARMLKAHRKELQEAETESSGGGGGGGGANVVVMPSGGGSGQPDRSRENEQTARPD